MNPKRQAVLARVKRMRERRRERALQRAAFGVEHQTVLRELVDMIRRTMVRRRSGRV